VHANVRIESMSSEPVLLPVWIMAYRYKDRVFRFLVNGQSGKATGQAPVSWLKMLAVAGIILAVILAVMLIAGIAGAAPPQAQPSQQQSSPFQRSEPTGGKSMEVQDGARDVSRSHGVPSLGMEGVARRVKNSSPLAATRRYRKRLPIGGPLPVE